MWYWQRYLEYDVLFISFLSSFFICIKPPIALVMRSPNLYQYTAIGGFTHAKAVFLPPVEPGVYFHACRGYFLDGRSPMLPATPHAALVRLAICIGCPPHTGINPSPFLSHIAVILNAYTFPSAWLFQQQSLLLSHNLLNCFCHFILEWPPFVL